MDSIYIYGGTSDVGYDRTVNEDFFMFTPLSEDVLLAIIADGMGSLPSGLQPAAVAGTEASSVVERMFKLDADVVLENPSMFLKEAMYSANRLLGTFKLVDEEKYAGFGCSMTCVLVYNKNQICFVHAGNTRINLIRVKDEKTIIKQITIDHTRAMDMFNEGIIDANQYYLHPDRYRLTSGIGMSAEPKLQSYVGKLKKNDILLLTTDGIHYGIKPNFIAQFVMESENWKSASEALTNAARVEKVDDNATASLIFITEEG